MNSLPGEPSRREVNAIDNSGATQNSGNVTVNDNSQTTVHAPGEPQLPMLIVAGVVVLALVVVAALVLLFLERSKGSPPAEKPASAVVPANGAVDDLYAKCVSAMALPDWQLARDYCTRVFDADPGHQDVQERLRVINAQMAPEQEKRVGNSPADAVHAAPTDTPAFSTAPAVSPPASARVDSIPSAAAAPTALVSASQPDPARTAQAEALGSNDGSVFTDAHTGSLYVRIPAGEFTMGAPGPRDQQPVRQIYLDEFAIKLTEVTNAEYGQCVAAGACAAPQNTRWNDPAFAQHPVVNVRWEDADAFARWVGGSLPTEAQWEKACRGTEGNQYPWGSNHPADVEGNFDNWTGDTFQALTVTGDVSPYGALNMAGNVREWVGDWYWSQYYGRMPDRNPPGPSEPTKKHTIRGGAFNDQILLTCVVRHSEHTEPATRTNGAGFRSDKVGFRVVLPVN